MPAQQSNTLVQQNSGAKVPELALLRIGAGETALRAKVRAAGGYWDPRRASWVLRTESVRALGLESRLVTLPPAEPEL